MNTERLYVRDRITFEKGTIETCGQPGWIKVRMEWGELRDYQPKDLIPCPQDQLIKHKRAS
ncbi:hypothetical protein M3P05_16770 [Sansalvadorimonas sp. 2012CJ34-2]|uniref:Uncharacterized protein n=1 Tax=Parendozoicomonas callyspongiae TaxID=2942213 RepID=A0ABT0PKQ9_9GAMM|nr:hypothetical protein [Sansalvadorimonas sp. 2012CJ34-2]MCL6271571.1 hypothetical protein [Sansalvadorimonas sp. 2012CJ34-2]